MNVGERWVVTERSYKAIGPELVRATDIDRWAGTLDAKGAFPDLVRRLLASSPGITNLEMRAHEGVAAPGWDGSATAHGVTVLPDGLLRFELGTDAKIKQKARDDYDKRVPPVAEDAGATFVFVTPRNWAGGNDWAAERARDGYFAGVRVLDAHALENWLITAPAVHYWLSERLGYRPRDAYTVSTWWEAFSARTVPPLPPSFFIAGRETEVETLRQFLESGSNAEPITVTVPWRDEVIAFVHAATADLPAVSERSVVVQDVSAWQRVIESHGPLVLIPLFHEGLDLASAIGRGHQVLLPAGPDDLVRSSGHRIVLPRVGRLEGAEALREVVGHDVGSLVALGRRSMSALFRKLGREPRYQAPPWAESIEISAIVAPLVCLGSWTSSEGDQAIVEKLTGVPRTQVERLLISLEAKPDPPFIRSGGDWTLASPVEAALSLLPKLLAEQLDRWSDVASDVLLEPDPFAGMNSFARMRAQMDGASPQTSDTLKRGISNALALAAAMSEDLPAFPLQQRASEMVHRLLSEAGSHGDSGWLRIARWLPALAEASPELFLDAIEQDLQLEKPGLSALFQDKSSDFPGPSSPHPNLLWSLELLCWSPLYFSRSASVLAKLTQVDPGGLARNHALASLTNILLSWVANCGVGVDEKIEFTRELQKRDPELGWRLLLGLLPKRHATSSTPNQPRYRDWAPSEKAVTLTEWRRYTESNVELAVELAGNHADRWCELIPKIDEMPADLRGAVLDSLERATQAGDWSQSARSAVWRAIESETAQHRKFSSSNWAMPEEHVERLEKVAEMVEPAVNPERYARAFGWRIEIPAIPRSSDQYEVERARLQDEALDAVLAQGAAALTVLAAAAENTQALGAALGTRGDAPSDQILSWLDHDEPKVAHIATTFVRARLIQKGLIELEKILISGHATSERAQIRALSALPFGRKEWDWASRQSKAVQERYWKSVQPFHVPAEDLEEALSLLCDNDQPWLALQLLSASLNDGQKPTTDVAVAVLGALSGTHEPLANYQMASYYLEETLIFLEQESPDHPQLPQFEFIFFELLHEHQPSNALYKLLNSDSEEFTALVGMLYRDENEAPREPSAQDQAKASLAWSVLHEWSGVPGAQTDGTVNAEHLATWVREARQTFSESGRATIGDELIGEVLAASPLGADGAWPAEAIRDVVEVVASERMETGLAIGRYNQRGVHSRALFDGGAQERTLADTYRGWASTMTSRWPRTARILRTLADDYAREARRHDADSERRSDDG